MTSPDLRGDSSKETYRLLRESGYSQGRRQQEGGATLELLLRPQEPESAADDRQDPRSENTLSAKILEASWVTVLRENLIRLAAVDFLTLAHGTVGS